MIWRIYHLVALKECFRAKSALRGVSTFLHLPSCSLWMLLHLLLVHRRPAFMWGCLTLLHLCSLGPPGLSCFAAHCLSLWTVVLFPIYGPLLSHSPLAGSADGIKEKKKMNGPFTDHSLIMTDGPVQEKWASMSCSIQCARPKDPLWCRTITHDILGSANCFLACHGIFSAGAKSRGNKEEQVGLRDGWWWWWWELSNNGRYLMKLSILYSSRQLTILCVYLPVFRHQGGNRKCQMLLLVFRFHFVICLDYAHGKMCTKCIREEDWY